MVEYAEGGTGGGTTTGNHDTPPIVGADASARQWAMLSHLVALSGLLGNGIGFVLGPLIVWLIKKDEDPYIDDQGRESLNFQITMFLTAILAVPLCMVIVGVFLLPAVGVQMVVLPIIAGIRANSGRPFRYPLTIRFVKDASDPYLDAQGRESLNFQITMLLAALLSLPFCLILVGYLFLILIAFMMVIFPIVATLNSDSGNLYRYPLTIRFLR